VRLLELDAVVTGFTRAPILHGVSLRVETNEIVGLLGANGAGKTTIMRAASGGLRVWTGKVRIEDVDVTHRSSWDRVAAGLGHVPEGRRVFAPMTVRENLAVGGLSATSPRERLEEVFELFPRLAERRSQLAGSLSGGEQQMLAIGRALMTEPTLLLVDELSAGLAPVVTDQLVAGLVALRGRGVATLLVEQSPHLIADVVDRVYLLERGTIVGDGTIEQLGGVEALADIYLGLSRPSS
jgi:branched-chain amino acid transport system ATP-binding protein